MPAWDFAHVQDALSLRLLHMFEGTFSLDAAQMMMPSPLLFVQTDNIAKKVSK